MGQIQSEQKEKNLCQKLLPHQAETLLQSKCYQANDFWTYNVPGCRPNQQGFQRIPQEQTEMSHEHSDLVRKCVGRIISKYPKRHRPKKDDKQIITTGTAFMIGKNILLTAAHNVYLRQFLQQPQQIHFLPQIHNNEENYHKLIPVKKYQVFTQYRDLSKEYHEKFDIALVVLQDNQFEEQMGWLEMDWEKKKKWEYQMSNIFVAGYPQSLKDNQTKMYQFQIKPSTIIKQDQFYWFDEQDYGFGGGPILQLARQQNQKESVKVIGLYKGKKNIPNKELGMSLIFNESQNIFQLVFQLIEQLKIQSLIKCYQPSCKKLRDFMKQRDWAKDTKMLGEQNQILKKTEQNLTKKIERLQRENLRLQLLESGLKRSTLDQQKLDEVIKNQEQRQLEIKKTLNEELKKHFVKLMSYYRKSEDSQYYCKILTTQLVDQEKDKFLGRFHELPLVHNEQLLILIDLFNQQYNYINQNYFISNSDDLDNSTMFRLKFVNQYTRIDVKRLASVGNWNHLKSISFDWCSWFTDEDWEVLVENALLFPNITDIYLGGNKVTNIDPTNILKFKCLKYMYLRGNPLNKTTKMQLATLLELKKNLRIEYNP